MFQQTFVPEDYSARKPFGMAVSLSGQVAVLAALALIPLFISEPLPHVAVRALLLAPKAPVQRIGVPKVTVKADGRVYPVKTLVFTAPKVIPRSIAAIDDRLPEAPAMTGAAEDSGAGSVLLEGFAGGGISSAKPPAMPVETPRAEAKSGPLRIGGNVAAANLIRRVEPVYPALAKTARVQGTLIAGHPLLVTAARQAIEQWVYRPTMLNGKPVEVLTTITIRFALGA